MSWNDVEREMFLKKKWKYEKSAEENGVVYKCLCGGKYTAYGLEQHRKTKKHHKWEAQLTSNEVKEYIEEISTNIGRLTFD
jgi:hypothetical protein